MNAEQQQEYARLASVRRSLPVDVLAIGAYHTVGLKKDGTVIATGANDDLQCAVQDWSNVIAIDAGAQHTLGLKVDGTVVATGSNAYGQCDVGSWRDIVQVVAGAYDSYGLKSDGTVLDTGFHTNDALDGLKDIKYITAGSYAAACVNDNGTIICTYPSINIGDVDDVVEVGVSTGYMIALSGDGLVTLTIDGFPLWKDIIAISAGSTGVIGIQSDMQIVAYFFRSSDIILIDDTNDIVAVEVGGAHHVILKKDGSILAYGRNSEGQCDVSDWQLVTTQDG